MEMMNCMQMMKVSCDYYLLKKFTPVSMIGVHMNDDILHCLVWFLLVFFLVYKKTISVLFALTLFHI